jgi:uncharacterized alpha-E superfamily protein
MLSRVAHSLYWMSRYIERAENTARLLEVNLQFLLDFHGPGNDIRPRSTGVPSWPAPATRSSFDELHEDGGQPQRHRIPRASNLRNPNSILSCIFAARENARMIRDQISSEMWETINELYLFLKAATPPRSGRTAVRVFPGGQAAFAFFQGLTEATYSRNEGWEFIQFGKLIERADKTTRILDVKYHILLPASSDVGGAVDTAQWHAVLRSASALEAYHRFYVHEILPWKVAEFLHLLGVLSPLLHYCVEPARRVPLHRILAEKPSAAPHGGRARGARLLADLQSLTIDDVLEKACTNSCSTCRKSLDRIGEEVVQTTMFYPAEVARGSTSTSNNSSKARRLSYSGSECASTFSTAPPFVYDGHARDSFNEVRLRPFDDETSSPAGNLSCASGARRADCASSCDFHGNTVHYFDIAASHAQLTVIEAESEVETVARCRSPRPCRHRFARPSRPMASADGEMQAEFYSDSFYVRLAGEFRREAQAVPGRGPRGHLEHAFAASAGTCVRHLRLSAQRHRGKHPRHRRARAAGRRLPGLCPCDARPLPMRVHPGALRQRLFPELRPAARRNRGFARLGRGIRARLRVGRLRSPPMTGPPTNATSRWESAATMRMSGRSAALTEVRPPANCGLRSLSGRLRRWQCGDQARRTRGFFIARGTARARDFVMLSPASSHAAAGDVRRCRRAGIRPQRH